MKPAVLAVFPSFSARFEGRVRHMYLDILGLVTTGVGCLIDSVEAASRLPWRHRDGQLASSAAVAAEWGMIKHDPNLARLGFRAAARVATLELSDRDVDALMISRLRASETWLRKTFALWDSFPADAQLGIVSMAWAAGANFTAKFPVFTLAAAKGDWATCAHECRLHEAGNPGVVPRNLADHALFLYASVADSPTAPDGYSDQVNLRYDA